MMTSSPLMCMADDKAISAQASIEKAKLPGKKAPALHAFYQGKIETTLAEESLPLAGEALCVRTELRTFDSAAADAKAKPDSRQATMDVRYRRRHVKANAR